MILATSTPLSPSLENSFHRSFYAENKQDLYSFIDEHDDELFERALTPVERAALKLDLEIYLEYCHEHHQIPLISNRIQKSIELLKLPLRSSFFPKAEKNPLETIEALSLPTLPLPALDHIFSYCKTQELPPLREVCRAFNQMLAPRLTLRALCHAKIRSHDLVLKVLHTGDTHVADPVDALAYAYEVNDQELATKIEKAFASTQKNRNRRWMEHASVVQGAPFLIKKNSSSEDREKLRAKISSCKTLVERVQILLQEKSLIDPAEEDHFAIRLAAKQGYTPIVKMLLKDPRVNPAAKGNYALKWALINNHDLVVKHLLADPRVNPAADNNAAIQCAAEKWFFHLVKSLLTDYRVDPTVNSQYPFKAACIHGHDDVVKVLLKSKKIDPAVDENYPIRKASRYGQVDVVKTLLQNPHVNPGAKNNDALKEAAYHGYSEVVKILLQDPRVDPTVDNYYPFRIACERGHEETVAIFLSDPRVDAAADRNYAIKEAASQGHAGVVRLLLTHPKVDPAADNNQPLRWAAESGQVEIVRILLLDQRVDPSDLDNYALRVAICNGHKECVIELLKHHKVEMPLDLYLEEDEETP